MFLCMTALSRWGKSVAQTFFDEQRDQSLVKAAIVAKYFDAWSRVMIANAAKGISITRLAYIDLFAGPGRYKDGSKSTPLMVLEKALADDALSRLLVPMFNDADADNPARPASPDLGRPMPCRP